MTPKHLHNKLTQEDIDAKLEHFETRLKKRLASIDSKVDLIFDRINYAAKQAHGACAVANEAKNDISNIGLNILLTAFIAVGVLFMIWFILMITL